MAEAETRRDRPTGPAWRHLPTGIPLVIGTVILSTIGVLAQVTALGKLVYDISGRELDLGLLGLAEFLPTALLAPVVGPLADRFDRRRMAAAGLVGEALCSVFLALYARTDPTSTLPIFLAVTGFGIARAAVAPAVRALPADLAGRDLSRVVPLTSASWQAGVIVGPVVGGFLYAAAPPWPFVAAASLMLLGAVCISFAPDPRAKTASSSTGPSSEGVVRTSAAPAGAVQQAAEGLRFVRRNPILLGTMSLDLFAVLFGGAVALLPVLAEERLGVGAVGLGWLRAAGGVGAGITTLVLAARPLRRHVGRVLLLAVATFGVATVGLGLTRSFPVALVLLAVLSAADAISVFVRATLVPLVTPPAMRGRVLATENVFIGASNELGAFESGVTGELLGAVGAVVAGGVATVGVVIVWWVRFPDLRDVDRFEEVAAHP